jgi:hypothetical protein
MSEKLIYWFKDNILNLKTEGDYSAKDFLELLKKALNDPLVPEKIAILVDARLSEANHSITDIQPIKYELMKLRERIVGIAVVVQSDFHFGFTRQASAYSEIDGWETKPFRDIKSAREWLIKRVERVERVAS